VKVKIFSACFSRTETTCETTSLFQLGGSIKKEFMSAHYIDIHIRLCVCVCLSVCLSVCEDISGTTRKRNLYQFFSCACCLWLWLGPLPEG